MKHYLLELALPVAIALLMSNPLIGQTTQPAQDQRAVAQAIETVEREWAAAVISQDVGKIDRIQADEFVFTGPGGELWTKDRAMAFVNAGVLQVVSFEMAEFNVRSYGSVALANFRVVWHGNSNGQDISGPQRMTDVFVQRDGRWQCVASHTTRITAP